MLLQELKIQADQIYQEYEPLSGTQRSKRLKEEGLPSIGKLHRLLRDDLFKASWYILFHRLLRESNFVSVEVKTTKSIYYSNQFRSFYRFATGNVKL